MKIKSALLVSCVGVVFLFLFLFFFFFYHSLLFLSVLYLLTLILLLGVFGFFWFIFSSQFSLSLSLSLSWYCLCIYKVSLICFSCSSSISYWDYLWVETCQTDNIMTRDLYVFKMRSLIWNLCITRFYYEYLILMYLTHTTSFSFLSLCHFSIRLLYFFLFFILFHFAFTI